MSTAAFPPLSSDGSPAERLYLEWMLASHADKAAELEQLCATHPQLSAELRELHVKLEGVDALLAQGNLAISTSQQLTEQLRSDDPPFEELIAALRAKTPRDRYRTVGVLGEGGMGKVYEVEDLMLHVRRAKKVVLERKSWRGGLHVDAQLLRRFILEAETLSKLDHPGIVPILDYGVDEEERIYYVMPVVSGPTLAGVLAAERSGSKEWTRTRILAELVKVCDALAYAHSLGIVHRDLKPTNIKLGEFGRLYVLDWGLSKELRVQAAAGKSSSARDELESKSPGGGRRTQLTQHGTVSGTPPYFSPEQARGEVDRIDERSDVYAIGAMLYELSSGRAPYLDSDKKLNNEALSARVIAGPPTSLLDVAKAAGKKVPAELQAICEKAMAHERDERYVTMNRLAADLRAFLEQRVVDAFEAGTWAETRKWVVRNKALASALGSAAAILVAGIAATTSYAIQARDNLNESVIAKHQADDNASTARQNEEKANKREADARASEKRAKRVTEFVQTALISGDPNQGGERKYLVTEAMDRAISELDSGALSDDPATEASMQETIARILDGNGRSDEALPLAERAIETLRRVIDGDDSDVAMDLNTVASCLNSLGRSAEALPMYQAALDMYRRLFPKDDPNVASTLNNVAFCLKSLGRSAEALPSFVASLDIYQRLFTGDHPDVAMGLNNVASCLNSLGKTTEALPKYQAALEMQQRLFLGDHPDVETTLNNVALCLDTLGRSAEALPKHEAALAMCQRLFPGDHPDVASSLNNVGSCLCALGRNAEALPTLEAALAMCQRLFSGDHPDVAMSFNSVASCLQSLGRYADALPKYQAALAMQQRLFPGDHPDVAMGLHNVAFCLNSLGRSAEALHCAESASAMAARVLPQDHPRRIVYDNTLRSIRQAVAKATAGEASILKD